MSTDSLSAATQIQPVTGDEALVKVSFTLLPKARRWEDPYYCIFHSGFKVKRDRRFYKMKFYMGEFPVCDDCKAILQDGAGEREREKIA